MFEHAVDVVDDLSGVVVGDLTGPARPDALSTVHQHHGDDGDIPLGLHLLVVVVQELEQVGVHGWEQQLGQRTVGEKETQTWDSLVLILSRTFRMKLHKQTFILLTGYLSMVKI